MSFWEKLVEEAVLSLESKKLLYSGLIPIHFPINGQIYKEDEIEVYDSVSSQERGSIEVSLLDSTLQAWIRGDNYSVFPDDVNCFKENGRDHSQVTKLVLFSTNDYLSLGSHPSVTKAAATAVLEHGMGPRAGTLMCGYTSYHQQLEIKMGDLKHKEDCLLCPTGFTSNTTFLSALAYLGSNFSAATNNTPNSLEDERVAIFSDAYNHASIIDGLRLGSGAGNVRVFVYKHCDMNHLDELLSSCPLKKKVVITDSLFSMDGDYVPVMELVRLRKKHGFLLVLDEAHATLVFGKDGGGVADEFGVEDQVDISIGTLSKGAGCVGGFIACSKRWKQLIQSRGRAFMFSAALPIPVVAAALAAFTVSRTEKWRRVVLWNLVKEFISLSGLHITSPIISIVVGSEENAYRASRHLLQSGFHAIPVTPPAVHQNLSRLRLSLNVSHTTDDLKKLVKALIECQVIKAPDNYSHVEMPISRI